MPTNVPPERLRLLLDKQIIAKTKQLSSRHMGYKLTQKGHDIYPVMLALMEWGSRWPTDHLDPADQLGSSTLWMPTKNADRLFGL